MVGALLLEHVGLPLPGETVLIGAAVLAAHGSLDIAWLLALAWAAATLGNMLGFAIGRYGGRRLVLAFGGRIGITPERLAKVGAYFDHYGDIIIVVARFFVLLRQLSGIAAGLLGMGWARFALFNAAGAALWVGFWGMLGYGLGARVLRYVHHIGLLAPLLFTGAALLLLLAAARLRRKRLEENH